MTIYGSSQPVLLSQGKQVGLARWLVRSPAKPLPESIINHPKTGVSLPMAQWLYAATDQRAWEVCTCWLRRVRLGHVAGPRLC